MNSPLSDERIIFLRELYEEGQAIAAALNRPSKLGAGASSIANTVTTSNDFTTPMLQARRALDRGDAWVAASVLSKIQPTPGLANLRAVCALRLGKIADAIALIEPVVLPGGARLPAEDTPDAWIVTLATARVLSGDVRAGKTALRWVKNVNDESAERLRQAIARWKRSGRLFKRPTGPVQLDFPPGDF